MPNDYFRKALSYQNQLINLTSGNWSSFLYCLHVNYWMTAIALIILCWWEISFCAMMYGYMKNNVGLFNSTECRIYVSVSQSGWHCFRWWLVASAAPSHYLNHCWVMSVALLGTNFSEILIKTSNFSFMKMHLKYCLQKGSHIVWGRWVNCGIAQICIHCCC